MSKQGLRAVDGQGERLRDDLEDAVIRFVAEECGVPTVTISGRTTLLGDLGVDGDDAERLLTTFASRFSVDLSGLTINRHFGPEGLPPWFPLAWLWLWLNRGAPEEKAGLIPICVADLVDAARAHRWTTVANPSTPRRTE